MVSDGGWLEQAVDLARRNVGEGGGPFGALVVRDGVIIGEGVNRVTRDLDPTAHAEVVAIRRAAKAVGDFHLVGAVLYTSCEPCPLCMASALWARIDRVKDAARGGFDDREFYELFSGRDRATWPTKVAELRLEDSSAPFDAWLAKDDRVAY
jgi:guanine deaminase